MTWATRGPFAGDERERGSSSGRLFHGCVFLMPRLFYVYFMYYNEVRKIERVEPGIATQLHSRQWETGSRPHRSQKRPASRRARCSAGPRWACYQRLRSTSEAPADAWRGASTCPRAGSLGASATRGPHVLGRDPLGAHPWRVHPSLRGLTTSLFPPSTDDDGLPSTTSTTSSSLKRPDHAAPR